MDKLQIARDQLVTALRLFLADESPISVQSLAGNAREILEPVCRERGAEPFVDHAQREFPERRRAEIYGLINAYRNAFKHNDRDDGEILAAFDDTKNDHMLFITIYDYEKATGRWTIPMQIFGRGIVQSTQRSCHRRSNTWPRIWLLFVTYRVLIRSECY